MAAFVAHSPVQSVNNGLIPTVSVVNVAHVVFHKAHVYSILYGLRVLDT